MPTAHAFNTSIQDENENGGYSVRFFTEQFVILAIGIGRLFSANKNSFFKKSQGPSFETVKQLVSEKVIACHCDLFKGSQITVHRQNKT